jgi:2-C-methyl-D-erythritol 2,4-cyclodiphosphate synthase
MLQLAHARVQAAGWEIVNLDCIVHAQRPKLGPHKDAIRGRISELLGLDGDRIGLKAKTGEKVGPVGRDEVIQAECVTLLARRSPSNDSS